MQKGGQNLTGFSIYLQYHAIFEEKDEPSLTLTREWNH